MTTSIKHKLKSLELIGKFLDFCSYSNRSPHTVLSYKNDLMRFLAWYESFSVLTLSKCSGSVMGQYREFLHTGGQLLHPRLTWWQTFLKKIGVKNFKQNTYLFNPLSVSSAKRSLCTIKNFFDFLVESDSSIFKNFKINPVKSKLHQITLKDEDIEHTKLLSETSFQALMKKLSRPKDLLIILLLYKGGLRIAELCQLKFESISSDGHVDLIRKRGKRQRLKIEDFREISYYLEKYRAQNPDLDSYLLPGKDKRKPMTTRGLSLYLERLMLRSGLQQEGVTPHSYRKACATNLYLITRDLLLVRNYLGHADAKVTQTYIEY
jgi:integrase/recombinase XerD